DGSLGLLELFLSLLRPLESFPCAPILWRAVDSCSSSRLLSDRRLFRVAFSHGAAWFHLLEQRRGSRREGAGCVARHRDVRDADCRTFGRTALWHNRAMRTAPSNSSVGGLADTSWHLFLRRGDLLHFD